MNLKMLKLQSWMIDYAEHDQGIEPIRPFMKKLREREYPYMVKSYPRVGDTTWPDGRFLQGKDCFFAMNGILYKGDYPMFKYEMDKLNAYQDLTRVDKILELRDLEIALCGEASVSTRRLCSAIWYIKENQLMRKSLAMLKKRIRETKNEQSK